MNDIRLLKYREKDGELPPRMVVLHKNNTIVLLMRNKNLKWQFVKDQENSPSQVKIIKGYIQEVIHSVYSSSLMLLRHKEAELSRTSSLSIFNIKTDTSDTKRWQVLEGVDDLQRGF